MNLFVEPSSFLHLRP